MPQLTVPATSTRLVIPPDVNPKRLIAVNTGANIAYMGYAPLTASDGTDGIPLAPGSTAPYGAGMFYDDRNPAPTLYFISAAGTTINYTYHQ